MKRGFPPLLVDLRDPRPAYRQIADRIALLVSTGELAPGDLLPSVRQVATDLGVNLNTVARAYRDLAEAGILDVSHGRRASVAEGAARRTRGGAKEESAIREAIRRLRAEAFRHGITPEELRRLVQEEMDR